MSQTDLSPPEIAEVDESSAQEHAASSRYAGMHFRELLRVILVSPYEGAPAIFLLIALQYYQAPAGAKAFIASSGFMGLLIAPVVLTIFSHLAIPVSHAISFLYALAGVALAVVSFSDSLAFFLVAGAFSLMIPSCLPPLVTAMWQQNAPGQARGALFSRIYFIGMISKVIVGALISWWLGADIDGFRLVILMYSMFLLLAAVAVRGVKSEPVNRSSRNPLARLNLIWRDPLFGYLLLIWFTFGFANLMTFPLRTEYIASGREFPAYSPMFVVILIEVVPTAFRLISLAFWGQLFDRINFIKLRLILNLFFGTSVVLFFIPNVYAQIVAMVALGIGFGGGTIVWNLWVTKFAAPHQTADYMAVHTFLTGVRGVLGPFIGYYILDYFSFSSISLWAGGLVLLSILMLLPILRLGDRNRS
ncbi:MAG: MFS transporter [Bdellovibrionales bacterium]|nr:MFS transporter [Bdellovibrionales bacterium]